MSSSTNNTHLLVYPFQASGHIIPLLDLTDHLLRRGLTITVIISASNLSLLDPLTATHPSFLHKLVLPDPDHNPSDHPLIDIVLSTQKLFDPIVKWFESHPSPPLAIISDFFLGWTNELASHLNIQHLVFVPAGALGYSIFNILWRDAFKIKALNSNEDESYLLSFTEIPNSPEFEWCQLSQLWRSYKNGDPGFENFRKGILGNMRSYGMVFNTFEGLEGVYIDYMKKQMGHDRVWAVGPLLPDEHSPIGSSAVPPHDMFMWLDKKRENSVVHICFGSRETLSEKQMSALTSALELSNVDFILCVKESDLKFIPSGFEERVDGRGFIIKGWAPQLAILRHRAVGSFVTHCGWNSSLEGVSSGVMMLTWPQGADQFANAKLLVDQLSVGIRVCNGGPDEVPDSTELARLFDESLKSDRPELVKVKELKQAVTKAVKEGTSIQDLDTFVMRLSALRSPIINIAYS